MSKHRYQACNNELEQAYQAAFTTPANQLLAVPWLSGKALLNAGRLGLISAHDAGIGLAKSGNNYKFYYSKNFVGWRIFEAWSIGKTAFFGILWLLLMGSVFKEYLQPLYSGSPLSGVVPYKMFFIGLIGLAIFGVRGWFCFRHAKLSLASGGLVSMTPACINFAILVLSIAAIYKGWNTIGVEHMVVKTKFTIAVSDTSLWQALVQIPVDLFLGAKHFFEVEIPGNILLGLMGLPFAFCLGAWFIMNVGFWPMAAKMMFTELDQKYGNHPIIAMVWNDSDVAKLVNFRGIGILLMIATYCVWLFATAWIVAT